MSDGASPRSRAVALVVAYVCLILGLLFNLVIPLIPALPAELGVSVADAAWVATAFFLTGAVANPVFGRLADMFGNRRIVLVCIGLLVGGSVVCALSRTLAVLLVGRVLQAFALPMMSVSLTILRERTDPARLPGAAGLASAAMGLGSGLGLVGGGVLLDHLHWSAVFWATAAASAPLAVMTLWLIPRDGGTSPQRLDLPGMIGLWAVLLCLLLPLSRLGEWGISWPTLLLPAIGLGLVPWWVGGRLRHPHPVVDVRALRARAIVGTHVAATCAGYSGFMGFIGTAYVLQAGGGFGLTLTEAGLLLTPASLSFLVTAPLAARFLRRFGLRPALTLGCAVSAAGAGGIALLPTSMPLLLTASLIVFIGNGILLVTLPVATAAFAAAHESGSANGVNALARAVGIAFASGGFALVAGVGESAVHQVVGWAEASSFVVATLAAVVCAVAIPRRTREGALLVPLS